ncbi:hypothetical protein PVK06_017738 [Gossypium arboreum]|uniref:Retrotransposon gag domain-containing protein n=1 Tax=Gossypium arboreum TaxID=29729 RepID=A0ABR0Q4A8_GOSAR|nr:hypothetical protein PVK06_017738 [Gossypium arboreum]
MACESPKQAFDRLNEEFQGTKRIRQQQLLNLRRDFEILKMKEEETVKQYSARIMVVVNSIKLLGDQFSEARIVEKSKGEPADRRSTKKVPFKPRADLPRAPLATKGRKPGQTSLVQMVQEEGISLANIAKGSIIQRQTIGSGLMCSAKSVKR